MKKIVAVLTICLSIISLPNFAQNNYSEGYIITSKKDTIFGQIKTSSKAQAYEFCIFKKGGEIVKYSPNQLFSYTITDHKSFSSGIVPNSFVETLIFGDVSLYRKNHIFYIQKGAEIVTLKQTKEITSNGFTVEKEDNRWRGCIFSMLHDCKANTHKISDYNFTEKCFTNLVRNYNLCGGNEFVETKKDMAWGNTSIALVGGVKYEILNLSKGELNYTFFDSKYTDVSPFIGLTFTISSPRISEHLSFQTEVLISKSEFTSTVEWERHMMAKYQSLQMSYLKINVPLSLRYDFAKKKVQWHMQAGMSIENNLDRKFKVDIKEISGTTEENSVFTDMEINKNQIGVWGGLGLGKSFKRFRGGVELRYYHVGKMLAEEFMIIKQDRFSMAIVLSRK